MGLIENSGNTKAIEVRDYILELESRLEGLEIDDDIDPEPLNANTDLFNRYGG